MAEHYVLRGSENSIRKTDFTFVFLFAFSLLSDKHKKTGAQAASLNFECMDLYELLKHEHTIHQPTCRHGLFFTAAVCGRNARDL